MNNSIDPRAVSDGLEMSWERVWKQDFAFIIHLLALICTQELA